MKVKKNYVANYVAGHVWRSRSHHNGELVNWWQGDIIDSTRPTAEVSLRGDKKVRGTLPFF